MLKKIPLHLAMSEIYVVQPGFEPRQTVPKTVVLPLHHWTSLKALQKYNFFYNNKKKM